MSKINVLVVEDESIVSKDIQHSLKKLGYNVVGASATGEKAIELANSENPDIVLMDIMLKGEMNGIEAADNIKKNLSIPIIFLTAYADELTLSKATLAHHESTLSRNQGSIADDFRRLSMPASQSIMERRTMDFNSVMPSQTSRVHSEIGFRETENEENIFETEEDIRKEVEVVMVDDELFGSNT